MALQQVCLDDWTVDRVELLNGGHPNDNTCKAHWAPKSTFLASSLRVSSLQIATQTPPRSTSAVACTQGAREADTPSRRVPPPETRSCVRTTQTAELHKLRARVMFPLTSATQTNQSVSLRETRSQDCWQTIGKPHLNQRTLAPKVGWGLQHSGYILIHPPPRAPRDSCAGQAPEGNHIRGTVHGLDGYDPPPSSGLSMGIAKRRETPSYQKRQAPPPPSPVRSAHRSSAHAHAHGHGHGPP